MDGLDSTSSRFLFLKSSARGTGYIMQSRERNEEGMGRGRGKKLSFSSAPVLLSLAPRISQPREKKEPARSLWTGQFSISNWP